MNNQFDELTKNLAQSVTRRAALKKFGVGLAGMALACLGLTSTAGAGKIKTCASDTDCKRGQVCCDSVCVPGIPDWCDLSANPCCCSGYHTALPRCHPNYSYCDFICS